MAKPLHYQPNKVAISPSILGAISSRLTSNDDPIFWETAVEFLLGDTLLYLPKDKPSKNIYVELGACSHWLRPHQTRLTGGGGFALPAGYLGRRFSRFGLPEFDWSIGARWDQDEQEWRLAGTDYDKRTCLRRIALPTRTQRHQQSAVNTIWISGTPTNKKAVCFVYFGFRKSSQSWQCALVTDSSIPIRKF